MKRTIEELGVTFDTEFEAAAAEDVSLDEDGTAHLYTRVDPKPTGFDEHFKGVPTQYRYSVRITAHREIPALRIHVHTDRELGGWYIQFGGFVKRGGEWAPIPLEHATNVPETSDVLVTLSLREGESVLLGSMPFIAPSEMETQIAALERTESHNWSTRVLGETAKGRKIWALETAPRAKRIVMAGTSQGAEPVAERLVELARRLTVDLTDSRWLLDNYQVCLVPMINPDGAAEGHSLLNGNGEVVAGGYKAAVAGEPCPVESKALADYVGLAPTQAYLEFHAHYRTIPPGEEDHLGVRKQHLLNPGMADIYPPETDPDYVERFNAVVRQRLGTHNDHRPIGQWWKPAAFFTTNLARLHPNCMFYAVQSWNYDLQATTAWAERYLYAAAEGIAVAGGEPTWRE